VVKRMVIVSLSLVACLGGWKGGGGKDDARRQPDERINELLALLDAWKSSKYRFFLFWQKKTGSSRSEPLMSRFESYL
jgi:hypothetical protein